MTESELNYHRISELIYNYSLHDLDAAGQEELTAWLNQDPANQLLFEQLTGPEPLTQDLQLMGSFNAASSFEQFQLKHLSKPVIRLWYKIAGAAIILCTLSIAGYFYFGNYDQQTSKGRYANDIAPGGNKAYLTLANGKRITLTDAKDGELAKQAGVQITKSAGGELIYKVIDKKTADANEFNTIETPRGGQYTLILPDGSKIYLNAVSKLRYPATFTGMTRRKVELLQGEGYFEVKKDKAHPFIVESAGQELEVLGTHFNINSYADEGDIKTTLLEGSVRISSSRQSQPVAMILKPGQQSVLSGKFIQIKEVDPEEAVAWKNGFFQYKNMPLQSVMRQIERWYNVDVEYEHEALKQKLLSGTVSRYDKVSGILNAIRNTGIVNFKIAGRKITVTD